MRRLFVLGCAYWGQILSYQKMIGQLQDAGNTTTLAHYLGLLGAAWMLTGLDKFAGDMARSRAGSPKLQVLNTALLAVQATAGYTAARRDGEQWRRLVESAVGAHLRNTAAAVPAPLDRRPRYAPSHPPSSRRHAPRRAFRKRHPCRSGRA